MPRGAAPTSSRLGPGGRTLALALAGLALLLALAWTLEPDPRGFGTHTALGLPPCRLREWLGFRCPACGVTTSLVLTGRGRLLAAWNTQPLGPLLWLALIALLAAAWRLRRRGVDADLVLWAFPERRLTLAVWIVLGAWVWALAAG